MRLETIRNFCIIAHIDHGKSTLADRLLELTGSVALRDMQAQLLDSMDLERERGITIKAKSVAMKYSLGGVAYLLNLIDTPGHVDFTYEVSRSMAACEGAILLVDATQGVQAQTVANTLLALDANLDIIPVINKVDSPNAQLEETILEMTNSLGVKADEILQISAKTGRGVEDLLAEVIKRIPPPETEEGRPLRALTFDSVYDSYRGVIIYVRLEDGSIKAGQEITLLSTGQTHKVEEVGVFTPKRFATGILKAGEVGYIIAGIKQIRDVKVGDTVTEAGATVEMLPGFREPKPMVFCGIYPTNDGDFTELKKALEKLSLNDSGFTWEPETSEALGFGFRCGFLGLLHMEIVQQRLERDMDVDVIQTAPNVTYEIVRRARGGKPETLRIDNPAELPDEGEIEEFREPICRLKLICPTEAIGSCMKLCLERRGKFVQQEYLSPIRVILSYDIPFAEIIFDFYDKMKSITRGYGTMDYQVLSYEPDNLVRLRILVASEEVDALSIVCHRDQAEHKGRRMIQILRKEIPRHLFEVALQAAVGSRVIARETIKSVGKNVTAKCYGGDISRKRKLLEKQKEGKKKMKNVGSVEIPQKAFLAVLSIDQE
ncbi:MAG: translation elongation factor 4 [Planctomycetes bacterium]|nr:translation elongation factor 4 [Planctomycetota bacterium]